MGRRLDGCGSHGATADCDRGDRQAVGSRSMVPTVQMRPTSQSWTPEENMTSLEILDHLIRYVRLREDLHIVLALERRDAGCRQCRSAEDPRVAGDLLGAGPTARRLLRRRRAAQSPRLPLLARLGPEAPTPRRRLIDRELPCDRRSTGHQESLPMAGRKSYRC